MTPEEKLLRAIFGENDHDDTEKDSKDALLEHALFLHENYEAFKEAGFSEAQAMFLVTETLKQFIQIANQQKA